MEFSQPLTRVLNALCNWSSPKESNIKAFTFFKIVSCCVAWADFEFENLLSLPLGCWDYRPIVECYFN